MRHRQDSRTCKLCTAWLWLLRKKSSWHRPQGRFSLETLGAGAILVNPLDSKVKLPYNIIWLPRGRGNDNSHNYCKRPDYPEARPAQASWGRSGRENCSRQITRWPDRCESGCAEWNDC